MQLMSPPHHYHQEQLEATRADPLKPHSTDIILGFLQHGGNPTRDEVRGKLYWKSVMFLRRLRELVRKTIHVLIQPRCQSPGKLKWSDNLWVIKDSLIDVSLFGLLYKAQLRTDIFGQIYPMGIVQKQTWHVPGSSKDDILIISSPPSSSFTPKTHPLGTTFLFRSSSHGFQRTFQPELFEKFKLIALVLQSGYTSRWPPRTVPDTSQTTADLIV